MTSTKYFDKCLASNAKHLDNFLARQEKALQKFAAKQAAASTKFNQLLGNRCVKAGERDVKADAVVAKRAQALVDREAKKAQKLVDAENARKARIAKYVAEKADRAEHRQGIKDQKAAEKLAAEGPLAQLVAGAGK